MSGSKRGSLPLARHPWRFCCPRGHVSLTPRNSTDTYSCRACIRTDGVDHIYAADEIIDKRERERADDGGWCGP